MTLTIANTIDLAVPVAPDGYAWWYLDAMADDGVHGLTVIFLLGNVFSPYYRRARRQGPTRAEHHCAVNAVLYGGREARWAFSEYAADAVQRDSHHLVIGRNRLHWQDDGCRFVIDDRSAPLRRALRGTLTVRPHALLDCRLNLDSSGRHQWQPLALGADVEVTFDAPRLHWRGTGYLDSNRGLRPLEHDFLGWDWSRTHGARQGELLYDVRRVDGSRHCHRLQVTQDGRSTLLDAPQEATLPATTLWRLPRTTRATGGRCAVRATWEDTPFYARSLIETEIDGTRHLAVHESLSLPRFVHPCVQWMLPFRMRRLR